MNPSQLLIIIIAVIGVEYIIETVLSILNKNHKPKHLPKVVNDIYSDEEYKKAIRYEKESTNFGLLSNTFSVLLLLFTFYFGWLGSLNNYLTQHYSSIWLSLIFFYITYVTIDLFNLPFSFYSQFIIEEKYGFNKTTIKTFIFDKIKGYIIAFLVGGILLGSLLLLIQEIGTNFWIYFWGISACFMIFLNLFYTSIFVPLFNKLTPLEDGDLREAIEAYSKKVNFPLDNIYVIDGSKRSTKANAYFSGLGKHKKIVLYDTLIQNQTTEGIVAVLAHEAGHYKHKHIVSSMALSILQIGAILFLLSFFINSDSLSLALGGKGLAVHLNLVAFSILFSPISTLIGIIMSALSRKNEYEADAYAANTYSSNALQGALKNLSAHNLSNLTPHPAYVFVHYSHPTLIQRLEALNVFKT